MTRDELFFDSRQALRAWLGANHHQSVGIWAVFYKKSAGVSDLDWGVIVEECLCFGWIDSLPGRVDDTRTKIYISPRKARSGWSRRNKVVLEGLIQRGLIEAPGREVLRRAQEDGSWNRFDLAEALVLPAELEKVFEEHGQFRILWETQTDSKKRQWLQQIHDAKAQATRARRIDWAAAGFSDSGIG